MKSKTMNWCSQFYSYLTISLIVLTSIFISTLKCPYFHSNDPTIKWMDDLQAWAVWKYKDVDLLLTHPNFSAHLIDNQSLANKIILEQQLAEFRSSFVQLLQKEHPLIKNVIKKVIAHKIAEFTKNKETDIFNALVHPCCQDISLQLTGISEHEATQYRIVEKVNAIFNMTNGSQIDIERGNNAVMGLSQYFQKLCKVRRQHPGSDLISAFVQAEKNDGLLISPIIQLFVGICASVPLLLGNMLYSIYENPEIYNRLKSDVKAHSNELLRYAGPAQYVIRYCIADCSYNGHNFRQGDRIAVFLWSANRDADKFPDPNSLDLNRNVKANMSFGKGNHSCLGASIVREISIHLMEAILEHIPIEQLSWSDSKLAGSKTIKGMSMLILKTKRRDTEL